MWWFKVSKWSANSWGGGIIWCPHPMCSTVKVHLIKCVCMCVCACVYVCVCYHTSIYVNRSQQQCQEPPKHHHSGLQWFTKCHKTGWIFFSNYCKVTLFDCTLTWWDQLTELDIAVPLAYIVWLWWICVLLGMPWCCICFTASIRACVNL